MKNNIFNKIVFSIIGVLVLVVLVLNLTKPSYSIIKYDEINTIEEGFVFFGEVNKDIKNHLEELEKEYQINTYVINEFELDKVNESLTEEKLNSIKDSGYILIYNKKIVWSGNLDYNESDLKETYDKFFYGLLKQSEIVYKEIKDVDELINMINGKKYTVFVVGKEECNYCTMYKPVINNVVNTYNTDIYYFDISKVKEADVTKFKDLNLQIKAECNVDGIAKTTKEAMSYPLTMITKKGATVDCLLGYQSEDKLVAKLKDYTIIK